MKTNSVVGRVINVHPIPDADKIESVEVVCGSAGKWSGVVKKGEFQAGSLCAVFLPDALLPEIPEFEFMRSKKFIVRQCRFRGAKSEVLIIPFNEGQIGDCLDSRFKVTKYEKPLDAKIGGDAVGYFPTSLLPKTDEPNYQIVEHMVAALQGKPYYITEKADGSSATFIKENGILRVCSRNLELKASPNSLGWILAEKYGLAHKIPDNHAIQAEMVGPKIQGNPMGLTGPELRVFNLYDLTKHQYLSSVEMFLFCEVNHVPSVKKVEEGDKFTYTMDNLWQIARGNYPNGKPREGVVIRPMNECEVAGERLSFKVINLEYKG